MKQEIKIRKYKNGDEEQLIKVYNAVFGRRMTLNYWNWKYRQNPYGFRTWVAVNENDNIVGQYCLQRKKGIYFGKKVDVYNTVDACIEKDYRGNKFLYNCLPLTIPKIPSFSFGFPEKGTLEIYKELNLSDGWIKVPVFTKRLNFFNKIKSMNSFQTSVRISDNKKIIDKLWNKKQKEIQVGLIRDWKYLKWRIIDCPNKMKLFLLKNENYIIGYFSIFVKNNVCYVTDILILNEEMNDSFLCEIEKVSRAHKCKKIAVMSNDELLGRIFLKNKFKISEKREGSYFGTLEKRPGLKLYLTFADTDSF